MSLNMTDAESSYAYGKIEFDSFLKNFMAQWYRPVAEMQLGMLLGTISDEEMPMVNPEALARAKNLFSKMTGET